MEPHLRARFYNPVVGRLVQEDIYRGDGLNLYAYCGNNPVGYWDPSGYAVQYIDKLFDDNIPSKYKEYFNAKLECARKFRSMK